MNNDNQSLSKRIVSIDLLRGLVMILMALDHTRDFFTHVGFNPLDINQTNTPLFLTRWITHLCATSFIFLAGVSAYLSLKRGKTKQELSRFLFFRGCWLIFLELTIISLAWTFFSGLLMGGVIWVIGWSMIILSLLIYLPIRTIGILGITLIIGHNLFDGIQADQLGNFSWFWAFLHQRKMFIITDNIRFFLVYPLIPWVGVMASGYAFGSMFTLEKTKRLRCLRNLGLGLFVSFVILRGINIYGDPNPWTKQSNLLKTLLSFINCQKYPPSLLFILITLALALLLLYLFEIRKYSFLNPLILFGRVPLFFYILHLWLIHILAILLALPKYGLSAINLPYFISRNMPKDYGYDLHNVYFIWLIVIMILYPICYWFDNYQSKHKYWWLKYL